MIMKKIIFFLSFVFISAFFLQGCKEDEEIKPATPVAMAKDPQTASRVAVDRFSTSAGTLMIRDAVNDLPASNAAINFDMAPFITQGLSPSGAHTEYYNFDVMPDSPAPIYVLFRDGENSPVPGQLNIIDKIPGESGYNDFWLMHKVTVPANYIANVVTSFAEIQSMGYAVTATSTIINCPVVPEGSVATKRMGGASNALHMGWYKGQVCFYFTFEEKMLALASGKVPVSPIYVTFNINPGMTGGGPASGFVMETGTMQTHNVLATIPADASYSPLWSVQIYDNASFNSVTDLSSAMAAPLLVASAALVNCPTVQ